MDSLDKANQLTTVVISTNLPPRYQHLVCDSDISAGKLSLHLKAKLCVVSSYSKDTGRSKWLPCLEGPTQSIDVHLDNYLRDVDNLSSMDDEESDEFLLARLIHSVDKSRFGMECVVINSLRRRRISIDQVVAYLRNAKSKQQSEKAIGVRCWLR